MSTNTNEALSEHDEGEDQNTEYVAVEEQAEDEAHAVEAHHDDDVEDARLDEDNEDREDLRRRRREEKAERAQRRKEAIARDKAELDALRRQNADLNQRMSAIEKRSTMTQAHALQQRIHETEEEIRAAEYVMAQATNAGNGEDVVRAMKIRDEAMLKVRELSAAQMRMQQANQPRQQPQQQQQAGMLDVMGHKLATDWAQMNDWFDPNGGDELSREAIKIDQKLINDGYNPNSLKYWQKLTELTNDLTSNRRTGGRGGPQMGSGRERSQGSSRSEVYISPERKAAMIETGAWEDPDRRKRMLRQYAEWDRNNSK